MKENKILKGTYYGTGKYWIFDNGQYGEKREEKLRDCWQLQVIEGKVMGLYFWQENENQQRLNSCCFSIYNLQGKRLAAYNDLMPSLTPSI